MAANAISANCVPSGEIAGQTSVGSVPGGTNASAGREAASRSRSYEGGVPSGTPTGSIDGLRELEDVRPGTRNGGVVAAARRREQDERRRPDRPPHHGSLSASA